MTDDDDDDDGYVLVLLDGAEKMICHRWLPQSEYSEIEACRGGRDWAKGQGAAAVMLYHGAEIARWRPDGSEVINERGYWPLWSIKDLVHVDTACGPFYHPTPDMPALGRLGERVTTTAVMTMKEWLREPKRAQTQALFPNIRGGRLSVDAVQYLMAKYVAIAGERIPSLRQKQVSPHILRHSAAMELLQAGVECSVIALWLGHESIDTTQVYLHAHLALKEAALAKLSPYDGETANRFQPDDTLLAFLNSL